jgi:hypothetical protein
MSRIFDPAYGDGSVLVATVASSQDAHHAGSQYDREREEIEHALRMREFGSLMHQRTGPCG